MSSFKLKYPWRPAGDQPYAVDALFTGFTSNIKKQTLLGVTGSGKTFSMACLIEKLGQKTLVIAPNKTLAAQLYSEFKVFFPDNAVEYFVSYYDYYRPEAYVAASDTYIEKDSSINNEIDKLRHSTTRSLLEREDVIVVASVSCIYGIGSPDEYNEQKVTVRLGDQLNREELLKSLVYMQYARNDIDFVRGNFRVRGDVVEIFPSYEDSNIVRIEFFDCEVDAVAIVDPLVGKVVKKLNKVTIYPKSHYVVGEKNLKRAIESIKIELASVLQKLERENKLVEKQRLEQRTMMDLEMIEEIGYCSGIENYSRHLTNTMPGEPPPTLIDFFGQDFLVIIDESHISCSQVRGMYRGDFSRKNNLVQYGFRLPSALDNRPLKFHEFESKLDNILFVSATPGDYEIEQSCGKIIEQIIRPTGLLDPIVEIRDAKNQIEDLYQESLQVIKQGYRVLVTTLTKKLAESITNYFNNKGLKVRYLHSDIKTFQRIEIVRDLRNGEFDILVGINLLREGLDIPEVALVGILDADKEGFLRSERSLIQTIGRASRNSCGRAILYAYQRTSSIYNAVRETKRRRKLQENYNKENNLIPKTISKAVYDGPLETLRSHKNRIADIKAREVNRTDLTEESIDRKISDLRKKMKICSRNLQFEEAIKLREEIKIFTEIRMSL